MSATCCLFMLFQKALFPTTKHNAHYTHLDTLCQAFFNIFLKMIMIILFKQAFSSNNTLKNTQKFVKGCCIFLKLIASFQTIFQNCPKLFKLAPKLAQIFALEVGEQTSSLPFATFSVSITFPAVSAILSAIFSAIFSGYVVIFDSVFGFFVSICHIFFLVWL